MTRDRQPPFVSSASGARFITGESFFAEWSDNVHSGSGPVLYRHAFPFPEIGPGLVTMIGGAPAAGKTTFSMQMGVEMVRFNPEIRLLICNCEMTPAALMDKTLSRLSGIDAHDVRHRRFGEEHADRLAAALATIETFVDRIAFMTAPFDIRNVAATADATGADVIVIDYIQRFTIPSDDSEARHRVNRMMDYLRRFASAGVAVVVISAVGRSRDRAGRSSYASEGLSLASFRESSELEFGADDALILAPVDVDDPEVVRLAHLKARHGMQVTQDLMFDRRVQSFSLIDPAPVAPSTPAVAPRRRTSLAAEIRLLWESSAPAADDASREAGSQSRHGDGDDAGEAQ
jgi:replicative DNA helicase